MTPTAKLNLKYEDSPLFPDDIRDLMGEIEARDQRIAELKVENYRANDDYFALRQQFKEFVDKVDALQILLCVLPYGKADILKRDCQQARQTLEGK